MLKDKKVLYPSGNTAAIETYGKEGRVTLVFSDDSRNPVVLSTFNSEGIGSCVYQRTGNPALICNERTYSVFNQQGGLTETGKWPRARSDAVLLALSESVKVSFINRTAITVQLSTSDGDWEFSCGHAPRRTLAYNASGVALGKAPNGKVIVDVDKVKRRFAEEGHLYGIPGPHSHVSVRPGLGSLAQTIRSLPQDTPVRGILEDLDEAQNRVRMIETLPRCLTGTLRKDTRVTLSPEELGNVTLSKRAQRLKDSLEPKPVGYSRRRAKVPLMPQRDLVDKVWGTGAPSDTLVVLCAFATWVPASRRALNIVEEVNAALHQASTSGKSPESEGVKAGGNSVLAAAQELQHIMRANARTVIYNVDVSESNLLMAKYGFRSVPLFFAFMNGKLVQATNNIWTNLELARFVAQCNERAWKSDFLPDSFSFNYSENQLLDPLVNPTLSLRKLK